MDLVWKIVVTSLLMHFSLGTTLNISFDLEDSEINEIIFVNETDIALRCYVTGEANDFEISIEHESRDDPVLLSRNDNCLKYVIKNVTMKDGGKYTCNVSFIGVDGSTKTAAKTLYLNVQDGVRPQCFRNGTAGQPYNDGDLLLITCYCRNSVTSCQLISSASRLGNHVVPYETKSRFDKMILRLLVKVGSSSSSNFITKYQCFNGPASTQRCEIGPQMNSSTDVIINTYTEDNFKETLDCDLLSTTTFTSQVEGLNEVQTISETVKSSPTLLSTAGNANTVINVFVVVASVIVGIVLITFLMIVFTLLKRRRKVNNNNKVKVTGTNLVYANDSFTTDYINQLDLNQDESSNLNDKSERHASPNDHVKRGTDNAEFGDLYAKVDRSVKKSGNDVLDKETASTHHISSECKPDSGTLYAEINKDRRRHGDEVFSLEPTSEHHNASEGVEDFASLYAKVDKDRRKFGSEANEGESHEYGDNSDMYAEIDNKKA